MKIETRIFARGKPKEVRQLLIVAETPADDETLDFVFGESVPTEVTGIRDLSDGYGSHYLRVEKKKG
jgi:hypothetical protein